MQYRTDTEIKKWKPKNNNTRVRCGPKLYVRGYKSGRKIFQLRFEVEKKTHWIDLDDYPDTPLALAREIAIASGRLIKARNCTVESLRIALSKSDSAISLEKHIKSKDLQTQLTNRVPTFDNAYRAWYKMQVAANRWVNTASERRPIRVYELHAQQHIGAIPLDKIRRPVIKSFMQPLFTSVTDQAKQLLGFMNEVFENAYDDEIIDGNPCPRKASFTIPKKNVRHSASLRYSEIPRLIIWLDQAPFSTPVKTAMRLLIVTAHRASVVANMKWDHLDLETGLWTVPERNVEARDIGLMKSGRQFASKLPDRLLRELTRLNNNKSHEIYVFSVDGRKPINPETLRRNFQKYGKITSHGFRNSFKTWALNQNPPIDTFLVDRYVDHALAGLDRHYRRDDLFQKRGELAERYCAFVFGDKNE